MIVGGVLSPLENVLTEVLIWLHETAGFTWAWSIVVLTVIVRMLLVPVAIRQIHSMQSLQIHAPEMKAIQQRYKADRQKQSEEL
ncbi:MAG: YidC/Oxa1 family membrane protein insertase, partial [Gaiellaceae bacterium]